MSDHAGERVRGEEVVAMAQDLGFVLAGVCEAAPIRADRAEAFKQWLATGQHGEMGYMAQHTPLRIDARLLLEGAKSIVMVADQYASRNDPPDVQTSGIGRVGRYARADDYHDVMKKRLHAMCDALAAQHPDIASKAFVDTAPVLEREDAVLAGRFSR